MGYERQESWGSMTLRCVEVIRSILPFLPSPSSVLDELHSDDHPPRPKPNARITPSSPAQMPRSTLPNQARACLHARIGTQPRQEAGARRAR